MADNKIPDDIIFPFPESVKEEELYKTLQDTHKNIVDSFSALEDVEVITAGDALTDTANTFAVNVDDVGIEIATDALQLKDSGVVTAKIANDAVDKDKIAADVAGDGLGQNVDGSLEVNVDDSTIETNTDTLRVKDAGITLAKMANMNTAKVLGRTTASSGVVEEVPIIDDDSMATASATNVCTGESIKAYVDANIDVVLSNVIFSWSGMDGAVTDTHGMFMISGDVEAGHTILPAIDSATYDGYDQFLAVNGTTYRTMLRFRFTKISGISTVTIEARLWSSSTNGAHEAIMNVDIGSQANTVKSVTSSTPAWVTASTIDVSSLSNGTTYDGIIQLKSEDASEEAYCSAVTLIGS